MTPKARQRGGPCYRFRVPLLLVLGAFVALILYVSASTLLFKDSSSTNRAYESTRGVSFVSNGSRPNPQVNSTILFSAKESQSNVHSTPQCLSVIGDTPPIRLQFSRNASTTRMILLAPHVNDDDLPRLDEVVHWLRPGWYTLLVEHPDRLWPAAYAAEVTALASPAAIRSAIKNTVGHKYDPATFGVLRATAQSCLASRGVAGVVFAQEHDVETVVYVRHFAGRQLNDPFPRYFLPHQRLPIVNISKYLAWPSAPAPPPSAVDADTPAAELILQHFIRDAKKSGTLLQQSPNALVLCTQPTRPVLQYGLCQDGFDFSFDVFLLEEVPPIVPRPAHPVWSRAIVRNTVAHRPAFWALALLTLAEDRSSVPQVDHRRF